MKAMATAINSPFPIDHGLFTARVNNVARNHKVGFCNLWNSRRNLTVKASSSSSSFKGVNMINGKKVNGVYVNEHLTPKEMLMKEEENERASHDYLLGNFVENSVVYRQTFVIRSYEIGPDKTATMETLMNLLQETALNHVSSSGLAGNGFGATHEMSLRKLIWVVTRINIQVERYSSWGDIVEIDTWVDAAGKNGMRRDWIIRDYKTQNIITRATSTWVMMNRETRRLSKIPQQVKQEVVPFFFNRASISAEDADTDKIDKLTDENTQRNRSGLAPRWNDMDANQHVNNVKYIGWILESVPIHVLEDYHLTSMTLEYRRECRQSNLLESLTSFKEEMTEIVSKSKTQLQSTHLLRMQDDKAEIVRARSEWKSKTK